MFAMIYDHERDLDRGRFQNFSRETQPYPITVPVRDRFGHGATLMSHVNWIAENVDTAWSVWMDYDTITFNFAEIESAVAMSLCL